MQFSKSSLRLIVLGACITGVCINANFTRPARADDRSTTSQAVRRWQEKRFGMFIHWGPVSIKGTEIGWSRGRQVATEEYDQLYKQFNPTKFDAEEWVKIARDAGMKYLVLTSKHHDGFCLWPSKYTDYHIGNTPFKRDVMKELSRACNKQGIQFCTYHSICDWYHPDYPMGSPGGKTEKPTHNMPRYYKYLKNQTKEILNNYGPLGIMWFDGEWEKPWTREYGNEIYDYLKEIQPNLVINNRVSKGRHGMAGTTKQSNLNAGDYDTPEQQIGGFNRERPWETCMTICQQWAWKPNDKMKTAKQCIQTLLHTVGGDGNLLFNVGPMPDGRIEPRQVKRLRQMGAWLKKYGDGVYGTRGGPFKPGKWGASTCKDGKIYLYIMNWQSDDKVVLPPINSKIISYRTFGRGQLSLKQNKKSVEIHLPATDQDKIATVVELTVNGSAFDINPVEVPDSSPTALKMKGDATDMVELQKVVRRAGQHEVISDDWGTLSWLASKPLGNAEGLTVGLATIKAGKTNPRHRHPKSEEVLYVLKGRIRHTLGDKTITMSAGDVITIAPGVFHNATCIGNEDAETIIVYSQGTRGFELE